MLYLSQQHKQQKEEEEEQQQHYIDIKTSTKDVTMLSLFQIRGGIHRSVQQHHARPA